MIRRATRHAGFGILVLVLLIARSVTMAGQTPVNAGGTPESFAQLVTLDIVPTAGATPSVTASAVMSINSSPSCITAEPTF